MKTRIGRMVVATVLAAGGLTACVTPVRPSVPPTTSTFEGFPVISYVPAHPRAMVYVFHGSLGGADFATKVETTDVLNGLVADGYGYVATESTERTGTKRWVQGDPSLTTNPDLARLTRLQAHLVATTGMTDSTPLVGIGMSNGARFVTLLGQTWKDAGYPVRAIWASMGRIADPVTAAGGLTVPTVFSTAVNDFTSPPGPIAAGYNATVAVHTPAAFFVSQERTLTRLPYQRIPGIDATIAQQIVDALVATGVWNPQGTRIVSDVEQAAAQAGTAALPAAATAPGVRNEVINETALVLAVHQFTAEYQHQVHDFFNAYVG